jgi:hypothetical protein
VEASKISEQIGKTEPNATARRRKSFTAYPRPFIPLLVNACHRRSGPFPAAEDSYRHYRIRHRERRLRSRYGVCAHGTDRGIFDGSRSGNRLEKIIAEKMSVDSLFDETTAALGA